MKKLLILLVALCSVFQMQATHLMGGEITWECIKVGPDAGKYIFKLKLYRDCDGTSLSTFAQTIYVWDHPTVTSMSLDFISNTDISPDCDVTNSGNAQLDCSTNPVGAVEEYLYESQPISLPGSPPTTGWHFTWDSCCRNGAITNLVLSSTTSPSEGFTLRASMFPYVDPLGNLIPAEPCFDSSPIFNESPKTIICTGYPFSYSHNASDNELDSISYSWDEPLDDFVGNFDPAAGNPASLPWVAPYAFNNPLPGNVSLNSQTGEISYNSNISGNFVTVVRIDAYKCGQIVASIYREIQAVLLACPSLSGNTPNTPPSIDAPFIDPITGLPSFSTSVPAGSLVSFNITGVDSLDIYPNGASQEITLEITGGQMSGDFVNIFDCAEPPCAIFNNGSGVVPPFSSPSFVSGYFEWLTDCNHIASDAGCGTISNLYTFAIKAYDDFCPAPAITLATISIEVTAAQGLSEPDLQCAFLNGAGDLTLDWNYSFGGDASTIYHIYGSDNIGGPYSLLEDVNYSNPNNLLFQTHTIDSINLPAGYQFFYLTQESACASSSVESDTITPIEFQISHSDVNCWDDTDGRITVEVLSTMLAPFSYYLNGVLNPNPIPYDTVFSDLTAGNYVVTVSDNGSCQIDQTVNITAPGSPLQSLVSDTMNNCYGSNDGIAIGSGAGGTPPYSYEWFNQNFVSFSTNDTAFNLSAGSYYLEVSDANGCDTFSTVQVIAPQTALSGSPQVFGIACRGDSTGMIIGDANGSWAPYQYYWISSAGDTLQSTSYTTTRDTLKDLSSGVYTLHVYDAQSCFVSYSLNVGEPMTMLSIDSILVVENIACFGDSVGKARLFASGGMPNYSYMWDNGETGLVAQNLSAGYRHLTLTDDWGCEVVDSVYISENPEIQSTISVVQTVSCYGQSDGIASISSVGGIPTYTYFWSNGHTGLSMPDTSSGLVEGSYYVTTRDVIGCEVVDSVYVSEPEPLSMIANELVWISCFGANDGLAYASGLGGNLPYTFTWMTNGQIGDTINTVHPGLHTVEVVDARGCTSSDTIFMHEPTELHVNIDDNFTILAYCIGVNSASLTSLATGGTPGYSYAWDDNLVAPQLTATASHLLAGVYTVTATDSRGCTASDSRDIDTITNTMSAFVLEIDNVSCFGYNNGSAVVNASGAHAPYSYQWFGPNGYSSVNDSVANLYAENYSVTVSDTNNCMVNTSINLSEPAAITYNTLSSTDAVCLGSCDGSVLLDFTGGSAPYYGHALDNNTGAVTMNLLSDSLFSGICAGNYTVSLTDANDCPSYLVNGGNNQHDITALDTIFTALSSNGNMILCYGDATASLSIDLNYFNNTYSYSWENVLSPGVSLGAGSSLVGLESGTYVLLANYMTCHASDTMTITEPDSLTILGNVVDADCYGASTGSITTNVSGGSLGYVYNWSGSSSTNNNLNNVSAGVYTLTVSDMYSCEYSQTFVVGEPQEITATINQNSSNTYLLESNNVNGGVAPYVHSWREASAPNVQLATGTTYTVSSYGDYFVRVTDAQGCTSESNSIEFISTTINEVGSSLEVSVYPNPFRSEAVVDFGRVVESASLTIVDMYGKVIERHLVGNSDRYIITNKDKASGVYFLKIETREGNMFVKLVIK